MVLFFSITLAVSIVGITVLLLMKKIELTTGRVIFASARPRVNNFFHALLLFIELGIPFLVRVGAKRAWNATRFMILRLLARAILWLEHLLQELLKTVREKTHPAHVRGEASAFLREVGEYKKQLDESAREVAREHA